jgi:zinc protease
MMRLHRWRPLLVLVALLLPILAATQDWPREQPPPPLAARRVSFPPYEIRTLSNGLQVLVVLHHEQPSVSFRLIVRAGAAQEPQDRPGVANFVATLLDQGTTSMSAPQIADEVDSAGGVIAVGSGNEYTFVNGAVVKDRTELLLRVASDLVQHPAFAPQEISLQQNQALSSLQVAYDDPDYIAGLVLDHLMFGSHPYGRPNEGTPESIARISQRDLMTFHRTWFVPNNALLAIVGDLTADEAFAAAEKAFGGWQRRDVPPVTLAEPPAPARRVLVIDRPGSAQTEIRVGQLAIARTSPDFVPFDLAIRILGGEGANRLFGVLRSDRGLTYGASAELHAFRNGGEVVAETDTRTAGTGEALRLIVDEFSRLQRETVHPAELQGAQDFIAGNFPLSIESPSAIAEQVLTRLFYGQSLSEITTYVDRISRVTTDDIQRVARQILRPGQLSIVLVGDAKAFMGQLKGAGFGNVELIPLSELDLNSPTLRRQRAAAAQHDSAPPVTLPPA